MPEPFFKSPWTEDVGGKISTTPVFKKEPVRPRGKFPVLPLIIGGVAIVIIGVGLFLTMQLVAQPVQSGSIELSTPKEILLGQPFTLSVKINNTNGEILKGGTLSVFLPPEMNFSGESPSQRVHEETIGNIDKLALVNRDILIIAASGTQSVSRIQAKFSYIQPGSNAKFEKSNNVDVLIGSPAVTLDFTTPEKITSNGNFDTKITVTNQSAQDIENLSLSLNFPQNYTLVSSDGSSIASSTWSFATLKRGEARTLVVKGNLPGQENGFANITASLIRREGGEDYIISQKTGTLNIAAPPLALTIQLAGGDTFARPGDQLNYLVNLKNNTEIPLENITVKTVFIGELFNLGSIKTSGVVNSINNTVTWNSSNIPSLLRLPPGETQTLSVQILAKNRFPITKQSDKNYTLKINGTAESPTVIPKTSSPKTFVSTKNEIQVAGVIGLQSKAYRKDPKGIINSGPYPPKANQTSQYTVHWILQNYGTDMSHIEVSSFLESYSRLVGKPTSNIESVPIYNSASGQIVWKIDKLAATRGVTSEPIEAVFQIETTPPTPYIGHDANLLRMTTLKANDDFINRPFSVSVPAILSSLPDDQSLGNLDRSVQP